ncbi:MAG: phosphate ABC transporter substrate-binding protein [Candidatus Aminicenantes bacterium]|nr:phosphate ABC transporter substrate-binding protein [Candidatus Aminicenantes bacterium]
MTPGRRRLAAGLALAGWAGAAGACRRTPEARLEGTVTLLGAWALYPMALKWGEEFHKAHPQITIDVQAGGAGKGVADVLSGMVDLGMVSRDIRPEEVARGPRPFAVTKDAVVAMVSADNPFLREIRAKGLTPAALRDVWIGGRPSEWGRLLGLPARESVHVFTRSDACGAAETWAAFLGGRQEDLAGVGVYGDPGLADAVRRDPLGIGYNNVNFAYDAGTLRPVAGLAVVPIDLDGSGSVEPGESFYGTRGELTAAIAAGSYPSPPACDLYLVARGKPSRPAVIEFLAWVLTEGQAFVPEAGYIRLGPDKLAEGLRLLGR